MDMESEDDNDKALFDRPSRGSRLRRSLTARIGRRRVKRVRALRTKREDRTNEKRIKLYSRKARTSIRY